MRAIASLATGMWIKAAARTSIDPGCIGMITFSLIGRDLPDGHVGIVLYLFRNNDVASVTTIATVPRSLATLVFMKSRVHLRKAGVRDATEPMLAAG